MLAFTASLIATPLCLLVWSWGTAGLVYSPACVIIMMGSGELVSTPTHSDVLSTPLILLPVHPIVLAVEPGD
jgi:hypothetical protein